MGRNSLASPDVVRLPLADGDFITVKQELNAGEAIDLGHETGDRTFPTIMAFLIGWSLVGADETPIPYSSMQSVDERLATLRALTLSRIKDIVAVLEPHVLALQRDVEEKNNPTRRGQILMDLALCKALGMSYDDVRALPLAVYAVALEDVTVRADRPPDEVLV